MLKKKKKYQTKLSHVSFLNYYIIIFFFWDLLHYQFFFITITSSIGFG